jgi:hypothetical protein
MILSLNMDILMLITEMEMEYRRNWTNYENCSWKIVYVSCNSATQARDCLMDEIQSNSRSPCRYVSANASRRECGSFREKIGLSLEVKVCHIEI